MDNLLESYIKQMNQMKEVSPKIIINDAINIFCQIGICEKNENNDCIVYNQLDIFNPKKMNNDLKC